ncbi:MAG: hypothetical protein K2H18_02365 [Muribaculaceae bacterium]|nr:hypothetical protein [Muribaculaceae bacterium]
MKSESYSPQNGLANLHSSLYIPQVKTDPEKIEYQPEKGTVSNLNKHIPKLKEILLETTHKIGSSHYERGFGIEDDYALNCIGLDEDGWDICVRYKCCGEWKDNPGDRWTPPEHSLCKAWGEITDIHASYSDDDTGECRIFTDYDVSEMWSQLAECLDESLNEYL